MSEFKEADSIIYNSRIHALSLYVLGPDTARQLSTVNISNKEIMRGDKPVAGGLYDAHMGTTDISWVCHTCHNVKNICPGHFGSLDLKYPVKSPMYKEELLKWLKVICYHCGFLLADINEGMPINKRLSELVKQTKTVKVCRNPLCGKPVMSVVKDVNKPYIFYRVSEGTGINKQGYVQEDLWNHNIKKALDRISDEDVMKMGKQSCHPRNFILETIIVPPNPVRPDIKRMNGARSSNSDTTSLLKNLYELNYQLPSEIPPDNTISVTEKDGYNTLDLTYSTMIRAGGGGDSKMIANTNKQLMSITDRLPRKVGRIRQNLNGKRVEYMIRSVITGDPSLKINEVGVPLIHARDLDIPETVTERNKERLQKYYDNGNNAYPGCKAIIRKDTGYSHKISHMKDKEKYILKIGDIVLRDMITGDYLCFNRQPSLLFSSIAGMRVVVMEKADTLRINPAVCKYFNADFDGDQMNSIVPQNIMARNEVMMVSKVARWLISPQNHAPLVGAFHDALIGIFELTKNGLKFNKWHAMQLFCNIKTEKLNLVFDKEIFTNRELVSKLLPDITMINKTPNFYKEQYSNFLKYDPEDIKVNIIRGNLESGIIDAATAGQGVAGNLIHIIANKYGNDMALETVYILQQITHKFIGMHGFTTGINDINISENAMQKIQHNITSMILESRRITERLNKGNLIAPIGMSIEDFYENEQISALTPGDEFVLPIFADIDINKNQMARLVMSGSKGKLSNFMAINGAIGVQTINGRRFLPQAGWGRTSPYFVRYDTEPEANGFISMSFRQGVRSDVYPFMSAEARDGMINQSLTTSVTGYINRVAVKNLESIIIDNLRKATKNMNVIQPLYAESGVDPGKLEKVHFPTIMLSDDKLKEKYYTKIESVDKKFHNDETKHILEQEYQKIKIDRDRYRTIYMKLEENNLKEFILSDNILMPVNIPLIIEDTIHKYKHLIKNKSLNPVKLVLDVKYFCDTIPYVFMNDIQRDAKREIPLYLLSATELLCILIRSYLCTSNMIKHECTDELIDILLKNILIIFKKSLIQYGTSIGIIAAQCVCEPFTQYILNSRHRTGGQGGSKTNAIVRTKEVLNVKKTEQMVQARMLIVVKPEYENDKTKVQEIANQIEMMRFERFISNTHIFYEEYGKPKHPKFIHETSIIQEFERQNFGTKKPNDLANWCIRFELNKEEMIIKSMKLETIILALKIAKPEIYIVHNGENSDNIILRIYLRNSMFKNSFNYLNDNVIPLLNSLKSIVVRGVKNILGTIVIEIMKHTIKPDGGLELSKVYGIISNGSNMSDLISNQYIDPYKTQTDSIEEMERVFGIVAARNKIIQELVLALNTLNRMHCSIFADEMCYIGQVTNIQNTGLQKRENSNITLRISFQTVVQVIQEAAIHGHTDKISGISGPIMMGTNPDIGTTYNKVLIDEEFLKQNVGNINSVIADL